MYHIHIPVLKYLLWKVESSWSYFTILFYFFFGTFWYSHRISCTWCNKRDNILDVILWHCAKDANTLLPKSLINQSKNQFLSVFFIFLFFFVKKEKQIIEIEMRYLQFRIFNKHTKTLDSGSCSTCLIPRFGCFKQSMFVFIVEKKNTPN